MCHISLLCKEMGIYLTKERVGRCLYALLPDDLAKTLKPYSPLRRPYETLPESKGPPGISITRTGYGRKQRMRRVCCFCETWESGGIESFLKNILFRMDMSCLEIDIVASCLQDSVFTAELRQHGVHFYELSGEQRNVVKNHNMFRELLKRRKYDVVHLNIFQGMSLYYAHIAKEAGVRIRIVHSHNTALRKSGTRQVKLWLHQYYKAHYAADATDLWACSAPAAEFMFPRRLVAEQGFSFIPNGIDTERFRFNPIQREKVRKELGLTDQFVIGNIGRLCYQKNQEFLIEMFSHVIKEHPQSRLLLVGDGEDAGLLQQKARALGISDNVLFYGVCDHVEQLLWAMDIFVFPSRFEGFGIVAIEAQAAGLPVIFSEFVPEEVRVMPSLTKRISLQAGAAQWAAAAYTFRTDACRELAADGIKRSAFDVNAVSQFIQREYSREM